MKKILAMMILLVMLTTAAFAENVEFMAGVEFGMSRSDVERVVRRAGYSLTGTGKFATGSTSGVTGVYGFTNSPIDQMIIRYDDEKEVYHVQYTLYIREGEFELVEESLIEKYGPTDFSSETGELLYIWKGAELYGLRLSMVPETAPSSRASQYSQRLITFEDGSGMLIEHYTIANMHSMYYTRINTDEMWLFEEDNNDAYGVF